MIMYVCFIFDPKEILEEEGRFSNGYKHHKI